MTFRHYRTDDPTTPTSDTRTRLLERLLIRHAADGFDVLELRRQMGKSGYVPTQHRWEDDGHGEDLTDEHGQVLLIAGMPPADLAAELIDTARQHVDESGERKNYRLVALRNVEGAQEDEDEQQEEVFRFLLPATMFGAVADPSSASESREQHDALMAANQQLQRQNDGLFRMLMDVVRQYPVVLGKSTELLEQLGDQLGGGRQHDLQQVLSILEFESSRDQRWMEHDRAKQRAGHRADLLGKSFEVAGPDFMTLLRKVAEELLKAGKGAPVDATAQAASGSGSSGATTTTTTNTKHKETIVTQTSAYAHRLDQLLSRVPASGIAKVRTLLDADEWQLIEAARWRCAGRVSASTTSFRPGGRLPSPAFPQPSSTVPTDGEGCPTWSILPRGELLARPGLALHAQVEIRRGKTSESSVDLSHGRAAPVHPVELGHVEHGDLDGVGAQDVEVIVATVSRRGGPSRPEMRSRTAPGRRCRASAHGGRRTVVWIAGEDTSASLSVDAA